MHSIKAVIITVILFACSSSANKKLPEPKIAKTVPHTFIDFKSGSLQKRNDTVYFNNSLYSGYCYELYSASDTAWLGSYFNGVEEGEQYRWYPGKQLAEKRFYINGKKEGIHLGWWPNGKQKFYFEADNNEYNGVFKEWYASGNPGKEFHYVNGHEEGAEKLWWENGTVRANYVIRNGKKYGLLGLKTCINPYDSIIKK
ncbi:MAG: hypothetical protein U0T68_03720 [Ferruginibacter sp.]